MSTDADSGRAPADAGAAGQLRPCEGCGVPVVYQPIFIGTRDLGLCLPHHCTACAESHRAEELRSQRAQEVQRMKLRWQAVIPAEYRATDPGHEGFNGRVWCQIKHAAWLTRPIGLIGPSGRSKTRMMALASKRAIYSGHSIGWCNPFDLERATRDLAVRTRQEEARRELKEWRTCRLLFLDDLGKSLWSATLEVALFELLEYRYAHGLVTHWSLNPQPQDIHEDFTRTEVLAAALDPEQRTAQKNRFAPILSRLVDHTLIVPVV
jgi:DNA replication protein DnaC